MSCSMTATQRGAVLNKRVRGSPMTTGSLQTVTTICTGTSAEQIISSEGVDHAEEESFACCCCCADIVCRICPRRRIQLDANCSRFIQLERPGRLDGRF